MNHNKQEIEKEIILLGDSGVGKTCIFNRFFKGVFQKGAGYTQGVIYEKKKYDNYEDCTIVLKIHDTAGQERFHSITKSYYQKADGIVFAFALDSQESFINVKNWMFDVKKLVKPDNIKLLVGTKSDLGNERQVDSKEISAFTKDNDLFYLESSALANTNISEIFVFFAEEIHQQFLKKNINNGIDERNILNLVDQKYKKPKSCPCES